MSHPKSLHFGTDSMVNTTLYSGSQPLYKLSPKGVAGTSLELTAIATSALVARINRNAFLPDTVVFPESGGSELKLRKWMKEYKVDGAPAHLIDTAQGPCILKMHVQHRLVLYRQEDQEDPESFMAHWHRGADDRLSLMLYPGTEYLYPQIIAAFILAEQKMRMVEKRSVLARSSAGTNPWMQTSL
ncbi:hypothetical protein FB45DRAFT_1065943 [Roridomyces roridus]|uniref:DUF6593 domain-containing protein n=1 Tax=Roridomyces roridus TaxID=1738132 RepID=A0AAD7B685_9AGAR|nr:hypothetical protein FB45DRAFT_1065943 [Roridomyces roridus]